MAKTVPGPLATHVAQETTSLATLWEITRTDGFKLYLTDHDQDIDSDGNTYESSVGYSRTPVSNRVGLNVDNLDVMGFLDNSTITDAELRGGVYDRATVVLKLVNWASPSDGVMIIRTGEFGEVIYSDDGGFKTELRGLSQRFSQQLVETISPICRADLGDFRCKVPLFPDVVLRNTAYAVGDIVRASSALEGVFVPTLLLPLDDADALDTSPNAFSPNLNQGTVDTTKFKFGGAARNFATNDRVDYLDDPAFEVGANEFTFDCWVNEDTVGATQQAIFSRYDTAGSDRVFFLSKTNAELTFLISSDGTAFQFCRPAFVGIANQWYHYAVTRDSNKVLRMYADGVQINGSRVDTIGVGSSTTFTRTVGSWLDDGFRNNCDIITTGFTDGANNGTFRVNGDPTATTLTITASTLVVEAGTGDEVVEVAFTDNVVTDTDENFTLGYINTIPDLWLDGTIDEFRFINGAAAWTGTSFTPPTSAYTSIADVISGLVTSDFDDVIYTCTVAGTTDPAVQPAYDPILTNPTVDGTCTFVASEAFTRAGIVSAALDNRTFSMTFPNVADTREVADDWFKYGAVKWETGNNKPGDVGLAMDIKASSTPVTTSVATLSVGTSNTFTRGVGSFLDDGFVVGQSINSFNFTDAANNGNFKVSAVTATVLTTDTSTLVVESGTGDEIINGDEVIELFEPMPFEIQVGDTFSIYAGCDKLRVTCRDKFDNIKNRRAEDFVPGPDKVLKIHKSR